MLKTARLYRYQIEMDDGVILRHQRLKQREGLLIQLQQQGNQGWGEIAPLPEFSQETLAEAQLSSIDWIAQWQAGSRALGMTPPSVAWGISCALAELDNQLPKQGNYQHVTSCIGDPDELFAQLSQLEGEKVAEVHVGLYEAVRDGMIVNMLLEAIPDLRLRLEGRQSWTLAKAQSFAKYINPDFRNRIIYLSEPCKNRDDSILFAEQSAIPLAWDVSQDPDHLTLALPQLAALIIKPTLVGSLEYCQQWQQQASASGLITIIASSLESSFGLNQLAQLAQWLAPHATPSLNTLNLMRAQLIRRWPNCQLPQLDQTALTLIYSSEESLY